MRKWIHSESVGNGEFSIADLDGELRFVWLDKYGIANIFKEMGEFMRYVEGETNVARSCVDYYDTGREGVDFIDEFLGIEEA